MIDKAQRNPITTLLCVGAIATFLSQLSGRSIGHLVLSPHTFLSQPWALLTTIFPHGGLLHVGFNAYLLWAYGTATEERLASARYALLVLLGAAVSMGAALVGGTTAIGLSGVVYAVLTFGWFRGKHDPRFRGLVHESVKNFLVTWFFLCIGLTWMGLLNVSNLAHGGGALIGWALGQRRRWIPWVVTGAMAAGIALRPTLYADYGYRHVPAVKQTRFDEGLEAFRENRNGDALRIWERYVTENPESASGWWNLQIAYKRIGDQEAAVRAKARALQLDPEVEPAPQEQ